MERPNPNCYWVVPGQVLAGEYPRNIDTQSSLAKLQAYLDAGVSYFLDLTEQGELASYVELLPEFSSNGKPVVHHRFPIPDKSIPSSAQVMRQILTAIRSACEEGHAVYVHCWGGVGRTGTVIGCLLVEHGASPTEALEQLEMLWQTVAKVSRHPRSPETSAQRQWVSSWEAQAAELTHS
ncbi:protein-tyrosine phosphatase family protein [Chitinolyticbacter meiyuanensis]|uniref:protein-tyrosine phosphatase family protein n=1 Tax=Chitinolyticbacter meiyuanensis TaxID=682798 RepID=UPI0011E5C726